MRLFIAAELTPDQIAILIERVAHIKPLISDDEIRWISPSNWHLTFAFLGETKPEDVPAIVDLTGQLLEFHGPFSLTPESIHGFPIRERPTYLALTFFGRDGKAGMIYHQLNDLLGTLDPNRVFRPHATLAKFKTKEKRLVNVQVASEPWSFERMALFESRPGPEGSVYSRIHAWDLAG